MDDDEEENTDDYEYEWVYDDDDKQGEGGATTRTTAIPSVLSSSSPSRPEGLEGLLADAKRMRGAAASSSDKGGNGMKTAEDDDGILGWGGGSGGNNVVGGDDDLTIKDRIGSVISSVVTADFFVVLALLAWFLAGIFCSYILKDDTVQIAFNMRFESVVQPALGLLMVASVAGCEYIPSIFLNRVDSNMLSTHDRTRSRHANAHIHKHARSELTS